MVIEDASKYSSSGEWRTRSQSAYMAACKMGILHKCRNSFIEGRRCGRSDADILKDASKYDSFPEWRKMDQSSYIVAKKRGILEQCQKVFEDR